MSRDGQGRRCPDCGADVLTIREIGKGGIPIGLRKLDGCTECPWTSEIVPPDPIAQAARIAELEAQIALLKKSAQPAPPAPPSPASPPSPLSGAR